MAVSFDSLNHKFAMNLKGELSHNMEVGSDPVRNIISQLPENEQPEHMGVETSDCIHWMLGGIFEVVAHDIPQEQVMQDVEQLRAFYTAGWKNCCPDRCGLPKIQGILFKC
ncbi:MAG: hypothetical protein LUG83_04385 [Lachnospiraceae bacterium]|nr:hypothetical protein [Lachnospiraceae bacterium]